MHYTSIKLLYFSTTGTTRRILENIAKGLGESHAQFIDLTTNKSDILLVEFRPDDLVIMGAPVYMGRLPKEAVERFKRIQGQGAPIVLVVNYGNRAYEDALLELKDLAVELNFRPLAAGAFIGEHSFSTDDLPLSPGRPDAEDIEIARAFGARVGQRLENMDIDGEWGVLCLPGNHPYQALRPYPGEPPIVRNEHCTLCQQCAASCPTGAIRINERVKIDPALCIRCAACIKNCPQNARFFQSPTVQKTARWLYDNYGERRVPELFF